VGELLVFIGLALLLAIGTNNAGALPLLLPVTLIAIGAAVRAIAIWRGARDE